MFTGLELKRESPAGGDWLNAPDVRAMDAKSTVYKRTISCLHEDKQVKRLTLLSVHGTMSPRSSLFLLLLTHAAHPPLLRPRRLLFLVLLVLRSTIGMQRSSSTRTRRHLLHIIVINIIQINVVAALEVLALRRELGGVKIVVDVRVGHFGNGSPVVRACTSLWERLVEAGFGD
jgi:hypothetical protein